MAQAGRITNVPAVIAAVGPVRPAMRTASWFPPTTSVACPPMAPSPADASTGTAVPGAPVLPPRASGAAAKWGQGVSRASAA